LAEIAEFKPSKYSLKQENVEMVVHYKDGAGRNRIKGGKSLKSSQHYPIPFFDPTLIWY